MPSAPRCKWRSAADLQRVAINTLSHLVLRPPQGPKGRLSGRIAGAHDLLRRGLPAASSPRSFQQTVWRSRPKIGCGLLARCRVIRGYGDHVGTPGVDGLSEAVGALREWQYDEAPMQLHPGDLGWFWRSGAAATAAAVRTWSRDGQILAVGLLGGSTLLRLTIAPEAQRDEGLAHQLMRTRPGRSVACCRRGRCPSRRQMAH